jgi:hypothetical protein
VHLTLAVRVLADDTTSNAGAGLGLVVFLVLLVGCVFLFRSMSGRIKRLPASFGPPPAASTEPDPSPQPQPSPDEESQSP